MWFHAFLTLTIVVRWQGLCPNCVPLGKRPLVPTKWVVFRERLLMMEYELQASKSSLLIILTELLKILLLVACSKRLSVFWVCNAKNL